MSFLIFQISMLSSACLFVSAASDMAAGVDCNSHAAASADPRVSSSTSLRVRCGRLGFYRVQDAKQVLAVAAVADLRPDASDTREPLSDFTDRNTRSQAL